MSKNNLSQVFLMMCMLVPRVGCWSRSLSIACDYERSSLSTGSQSETISIMS